MHLARRAVLVVAALAVAVPVVSPLAAPVSASDPPWTTPTIPPRCTTAQVDAGDVANCVVYGGRGRPDENGWPSPPFPETVPGQPFPPAGWVYDGWGYTGSPALAGWEAGLLSNTSSVGRIRAGALDLLPDALPLFDGFLREIAARGYLLRDGIGYNYRCTITSATTGCQNLTRTSLSYHAYGLAIDINGSLNPPRTYSGVDGATACATPMVTDMPRWVVQTAEKWGLYWGGYGWSSGCASPETQRTTAYRDPTHFEFRGTPQQARTIAARNGSTGIPGCYEVVDAAGSTQRRCADGSTVPAAGTRTVVDTDAPTGSVAALVNLTATGTTAPGFVTAESCGPAPAARAWSNLNQRVGATVANLAVVPVDAQGRFCLFQSSPTHLIVDVQGFFLPAAAAPDGSMYRAVAASRALDTRLAAVPPATVAQPVPAGAEVPVRTAPATATAVLANLTVTEPDGDGYVTADSCASLQPGPQKTSNVNFGRGATVANLAVVPTAPVSGGAEFCAFAFRSTHLVTDVVGWFGPAGTDGLGYSSLPPSRLLDSRLGGGVPLAADSITRIQGPAGVAAVLANLVLVDTQGPGYATAGPCSTMTAGPQRTSNVNATVGAAVANLAVTSVDPDGGFCVYTSVATHLVVDLQGSFSTTGDLRLKVAAPLRELDTRG